MNTKFIIKMKIWIVIVGLFAFSSVTMRCVAEDECAMHENQIKKLEKEFDVAMRKAWSENNNKASRLIVDDITRQIGEERDALEFSALETRQVCYS